MATMSLSTDVTDGERNRASRQASGETFLQMWRLTANMKIDARKAERISKECGRKYLSDRTLAAHMIRTHTGEKPFTCKECGMGFTVESSLLAHAVVHTGEKPFTCNVCGKSFSKTNALSIHARIVHAAEKPYPCEECGKRFPVKRSLLVHTRIHTGEKPYKCDQCGKGFSSNRNLTVHKRIHTGERPFTCKECGRGFNEKGRMVRHMRVHTGEKPYTCKQCGHHFGEKRSLSFHLMIHAGEKPHSCKHCGKLFRRTGHLSSHMRIHTGEQPYSCKQCGKTFAHSASLRLHMMKHTGELPHSCGQCGKKFSGICNLRAHMMTHTVDKPYACKHCGKAFAKMPSMLAHVKRHEEKKPYTCSECGKKFAHSYLLSAHLRVHTGERPYVCGECGEAFSESRNLHAHARIHSREEPHVRRRHLLVHSEIDRGTYESDNDQTACTTAPDNGSGSDFVAAFLDSLPSTLHVVSPSMNEGITDVSPIYKHPNIAITYGIRQAASVPVLLLEQVETSLSDLLRDLGQTLTVRERIDLAAGIASAIDYLHNQLGDVHGFIDADNILVTSLLTAKILDPVAARLTNEKMCCPLVTVSDDVKQLTRVLSELLGCSCPLVRSVIDQWNTAGCVLGYRRRSPDGDSPLDILGGLDELRRSEDYQTCQGRRQLTREPILE